ncbi:hypothetical protein PIROE2DRAFT_46684, partial [Piromyces sp. E2]
RKKKEYVPAYRSGSYAILISLYECTSNSSMNESMLEPFLTKAEIIRHGQQYCSSSFTVPLSGTHFTAWRSMNELIRHELVGKMGSPSKYYLTDEGVELAKRLYDVMEQLGPPNTSNVPGEYEIILVLDNREVSTKTDRTYIQNNLALRGINCDTRPLVLGDVTWIAKEKKLNGIEIILDHIIERKRIDDLVSSIKDGRFREQKNRLKNCGINDVIYLVEGTKTKQSEVFGADRIMSAICGTQIYNSFFIKQTSDIEETMNYFSIITHSIKMKYKNQPIYAYSFKRNTIKELPYVRNIVNQRDQCFYHITYEYFSSINSKTQSLTISNIWATWLKCVRGVSTDKANTIIYKYPTFAL